MRRLIKFIFAAIFLVVGVLFVAPFLIPMDSYKQEAAARLSEMFGREFRVDGSMRLKLFPNVSVSLNKVVIGNATGFSEKPFATVDEFNVEVPFSALMDKKIIVKSFVLAKPIVNLEVNKNGANNWQFDVKKPASSSIKHAPYFAIISQANAAENSQFSLESIALKHAEIKSGSLNYFDARNGTKHSIGSVDVVAKADSFSKPLTANGAAVWNNEKIRFNLLAASFKSLASGEKTPVKLSLDSENFKLSFNGKMSASSVNGQLEIGSPSLVKAAAWLGSPITWNKTTLKFAARGELAYSPKNIKLESAQFLLDDIKLKGALSSEFDGKPNITANLQSEELNLNPYASEAKSGFSFISSAFAAAPWKSEVINLSSLRSANADISLKVAAINFKELILKNVNLRAYLKGGNLALNIANIQAFGGDIKGAITLNGASERAGVGINISGVGVAVEPLLKYAARNDRISGNAEFSTNLKTFGATEVDMVSNLSGSGKITVRDGSIKGVNLAQMVRNVRSAFTGEETAERKTDFAELGGTYTMASGILSNSDLVMKAPYLRLKGQGEINLAAYTINYRLTPELVDTGKGQGGAEKSGISVPVIISGDLANPSFAPDLAAIINETLKNPEKIKEKIDAVKDAIKENKGEIKQQIKDLKQGIKDPKKLLENQDQINDLLKSF